MTLLKNLIGKETKKDNRLTIILDTSALNSAKSMEVIEAAAKVVILTGTIDEIDNLKTAGGIFGNNLRAVARKSREDAESKKFVCVPGYEKYKYQDKNIVDFCKRRKNKKTTILTADNNLCNLAKAYHIEYIFMQPEDRTEQVKEKVEELKEEVAEKEEVSDIEEVGTKSEVSVAVKEETKPKRHIYFKENGIYIDSQKCFEAYNFLETATGITEKLDNFDEGDFIYEVLCSRNNTYMKVIKYKIIKNDGKYDYQDVQVKEIWFINDIFRPGFSNEVEEKLLEIFRAKYT